jgi:serine/threonine protein kinase
MRELARPLKLDGTYRAGGVEWRGAVMDHERWQRIERLYHDALARPTAERAAFLARACGGDDALAREVASLLEQRPSAEGFLGEPAAAVMDPQASSDVSTVELPAAGATLGGYRIERLLGRGGMGAVFLAYDTTLHRRVAVKVLADPGESPASRSRLVREARNAAALNHPNICTIHEVGDASEAAFIAMEYVEGRSLRERLDEGALPVDEAVRYGIQAAEALAYAHAQGVVHRDFKAANVIITPEGRLKIVDFGLARRDDALLAAATTMSSLVPEGAAAGTPYAMAPEQVRGEATDARTDIWALGVLLYEMLGGDQPFTAATVPELFSSILTKPPAALPQRVPVELRALIERCLEKDRAHRYQNAGDVRTALATIQAGTVAPWIAWRYHVRRRPGWVSAAALAVLATVLVGVNAGGVRDRLLGTPPAAAPIRLAVLPFENLTGDPAQEYFSDGLTDEMITQLGRLHPQRLSVIARTSSMRYKNRGVPIAQIGAELGVDYLLEGSARREGSRVRINTTLVDVRAETQRWTDTFERELADILVVQSDVAKGVASALALALLPAEQARLAGARQVNAEAYEAYLKGVSYANRLTRADLDTALQYFELAAQNDSNSALAYVGIASVWSTRQQMQFVTPAEAAPRLKAAAAKALALDSTLPEVHLQLAVQYAWTDWNWAGAEREFQRAIELNSNYAEARAFYSHYLYIMKRPAEAMVQIDWARQLDPFSDLIHSLYGVTLQSARRFDEAIVQHRNALKTAPGSPLALRGLARSLEQLGMYEEALAAEKAYQTTRGDREALDALDRGYAQGGYRGAMRLAARTLAARPGQLAPIDIALFYVRAGESDQALTWLERAYDAHHPDLPYMSSAPWYDTVRREPRFQALLRRMALPN